MAATQRAIRHQRAQLAISSSRPLFRQARADTRQGCDPQRPPSRPLIRKHQNPGPSCPCRTSPAESQLRHHPEPSLSEETRRSMSICDFCTAHTQHSTAQHGASWAYARVRMQTDEQTIIQQRFGVLSYDESASPAEAFLPSEKNNHPRNSIMPNTED